MLTTDQKEAILQKAGIALPASWVSRLPGQLQQAGGKPLVKQGLQADSRPLAEEERTRTIDALFDEYSARRAAKSLQDDDAARRTGTSSLGWGGPTS